ncbi:MAG: Gfo/Idh/MocA family oxidoreductase [Armatimonadota bacterium]
MKIAFIGLQHWHVPFYLEALADIDQPVAAIADVDKDYVERTAEWVDAAQYTDYEKMLREIEPDLIWAHAPHDQMTELADWLVDHDLPFHMEKPMGLSWRRLAQVARKANEKDLWNGVALVSRQYGIIQRLRELGEDIGTVGRYYYGLFAGPPFRYPDLHCGWMLQPERTGAGPLWNFGAHVVDLFLLLGKSPIVEVKAHWTHSIHGLDIEDLCCIQMINADGAVGVGEISYTTPEGYERYFSISTDRLQVCTEKLGEGTIKRFEGDNEEIDGAEFNDVYPYQTRDIVECFDEGREPVADINDMVETLRVMEAAKESARTGQVVRLDEQWEL